MFYAWGRQALSKVFYLANTLPNSWEGREKYEAVANFERSVDRPEKGSLRSKSKKNPI